MIKTRATIKGWIASWALGRSGSVTLSLASVLGLAIVIVVAAACAWTLYSGATQAREARIAKAEGVTSVLLGGVSQLLSHGDLAGAQRIVAEAAASELLDEVHVRLPNGQRIADSQAGVATIGSLPQRWESGDFDAASTATRTITGDKLTVVQSAAVPGRGSVQIETVANLDVPLLGDARSQMGMGAVVIVGLAGLAIATYVMRDRLRGLVAVGRALSAAGNFESGELPTTGLRLNESLGDEAVNWNRVLDERNRLHARAVLESAAERFAGIVAGGGEYAQAFDALWLGMLILGEDGTVMACNGAAAVLLKKQKTEVVNHKLSATIDEPTIIDAVAGVLAGKTKQRVTVEVTRATANPDEKAVMRCTIRPLRHEDSASAILLFEDITQQRVADESRNAFVAQATHELRTPLTTIRLYHEQLLELGEEGDKLEKAKCLNVIGSEVRRLERIVGDMLSVSEIEAGTFKLIRDDVKLDEILRTLESEFVAAAADKEITLAFDHAPKLPTVAGDRDKVVMALHNLIANAIKYTPAGGTVTVRAGHEGQAVSIEVIDNGIGIAEEEHELVFQKFYRSKDKRVASISGSGIGLALAREVVRLHGGDVTIKSAIDRGSTFTLSMPVADQQQHTQRAAA
jgi:signal transduction histidine kinase